MAPSTWLYYVYVAFPFSFSSFEITISYSKQKWQIFMPKPPLYTNQKKYSCGFFFFKFKTNKQELEKQSLYLKILLQFHTIILSFDIYYNQRLSKSYTYFKMFGVYNFLKLFQYKTTTLLIFCKN